MNNHFGKIGLLLTFSVFFFKAKAQQRICDLQAICISPADTVISGSSLPLRFGRKNLGPDLMLKNDTTFYLLYKIVSGKKNIVYSGAFGEIGNKDSLPIGGSTIYAENYGIGFNYPDLAAPLIVDFCVQIDSWKRNAWGDTIQFGYRDPNDTNNTCCKQVIVMPKANTTLLDWDTLKQDFTISPNPASQFLYVHIKELTGSEEGTISIRDLRGRLLMEKVTKSTKGILSLNVENLPLGMYTISLLRSEGLATRKLAISR